MSSHMEYCTFIASEIHFCECFSEIWQFGISKTFDSSFIIIFRCMRFFTLLWTVICLLSKWYVYLNILIFTYQVRCCFNLSIIVCDFDKIVFVFLSTSFLKSFISWLMSENEAALDWVVVLFWFVILVKRSLRFVNLTSIFSVNLPMVFKICDVDSKSVSSWVFMCLTVLGNCLQ